MRRKKNDIDSLIEDLQEAEEESGNSPNILTAVTEDGTSATAALGINISVPTAVMDEEDVIPANIGKEELEESVKDIEADAVLGLWSDSDFAGGDTDAKGHTLRGAWAPTKKWKIGLTYFINETGVELDDGDNYRRLQLDWAYKF